MSKGLTFEAILDLCREAGLTEVYPSSSEGIPGLDPHRHPSFLITHLPYTIPTPHPSPLPSARIAPFACANHYRELSHTLRRIVSLIGQRTGHPKSAFRVFSNSPLPERAMAHRAGLGVPGRNGLIIHPVYGSYIALGGILLPFPLDLPPSPPPPPPLSPCGPCTACLTACPTRALPGDGTLRKERCIQYWASTHGIVPDPVKAAWSPTLYGCPHCQAACPYNRRPAPGRRPVLRGRIGPALPLTLLLGTPAPLLKALLRGSALHLGWLSPLTLQRNALLAAAATGARPLLPYVEPYLTHPDPVLRDAARWAVLRLS
ncbi:iron-sulfur protein [Spirochaeta thermophila DSM 6578]|uniref:Iron-sulfur protein n=1 Tax=Winmispira thermophila (strain ATCC 700085 / DSM 6578 / Z-1203) TaxID=869211 RepID=G0GCQ5_WINT7|nr:4Fe-4S double cluster binding domain-containing protein [Spirochaeta thermophila]AEJ60474.1 iron-sulfur protein [Spirochaeta thermophila DSM 6578]